MTTSKTELALEAALKKLSSTESVSNIVVGLTQLTIEFNLTPLGMATLIEEISDEEASNIAATWGNPDSTALRRASQRLAQMN